uniref:CBM39 domain-containing protein n=1 Tax=Branchiostoma floridae TaxID=7739 RepID=C3Y4S9_BRAFL|eukprot:XP_002608726.1 hypothetical protein BRAFLDRAFT_73947 [Branchiostoma floridae]
MIALYVLALISCACAQYTVRNPVFEVMSPQGLRISYTDTNGVILVGLHFNIDTPLAGVAAGQFNIDITDKSGGAFVYENQGITVRPGQTIHYWVLVIHTSGGYQQTEQSWTVPSRK